MLSAARATVSRELRRFLRNARRQPAFTCAVIAILALGIATSAVVFSVVDVLVLDPFPFPEAERLLVVGTAMPQLEQPLGYFERLSGPEIADLEARLTSLERLLPYDLNSVRARGDEFPLRLFAGFFWDDPFSTLGVEPLLGRGFRTAEITAGTPVAVISHDLWQNQLGGDPRIVGQALIVDGEAHEILGVMAPFTTLFGTDVWLPMTTPLAALPRQQRQFNLLARLAPGADLATANAELMVAARAIEAEHGAGRDEYRDWRLEATTWNLFSSFSYRREALLTLGAVLFVLLLVCANLANLFLVRAAGRRQETAIQVALGAPRRRIFAQALGESALFALAGGALGVLLAGWGLELAAAHLPGVLQPSGRGLELDGRVLGWSALVTLLAALLFGSAPAWHAARADLRQVLGGVRSLANRENRALGRLFVAVQVGLALVLLSGAGLLARGLYELLDADLGFETENLVSMRLTLPRAEYEGEAVTRFFDRLAEETAALPGARQVSLATQVAPSTRFRGELHLEGGDDAGEARPRPLHTVVGDDYFATLGLPLLRGRGLDARDRAGSPPALVINEVAAERYFPGRDPLGQRARVMGSSFDSGWGEIVGVVAAAASRGPSQPPDAEIYTHHRQAGGRFNQLFLMARSAEDPATLVPQIRRLVERLDPEQPIYAISTAEDILAAQTAPRRAAAGVLAGLSGLALVLSALGIYGVVAFSVASRRREMGLRLALGATPPDVVRLVLRETLAIAAFGLVAGLAAAWGLGRLLAGAFGELGELDPLILGGAAALLLVAALAAAAMPAGRAAQVGPARALREE